MAATRLCSRGVTLSFNPLGRLRRARQSALARRRDARLNAAFAREEKRGMRLAVGARFVALAIVGAWLVMTWRDVAVLYYLALLVVFMGAGAVLLWLEEGGRPRAWHKYAFAAFDGVLLTVAVLGPNPLLAEQLPPTFALRWGSFLYFFLFVSLAVLTLSSWFVMWTGVILSACWSVGVLWIIAQPQTVTTERFPHDGGTSLRAHAAAQLDPHTVDVSSWYQQVLLLLVVSAILALAVHRSRALVRRQAVAERERGNLARYFSPNVVDALAALDDPLGRVRRQEVAVLFADIVGFTAFAERAEPEEAIALLQEHHERLAAVVFEHGGTVDKYIGDAVMATFGTPRPVPDDAARALSCALAMLEAMRAWNAERTAAGRPPVRIGIGLDYGPVVLGNIGSERRLEFTVIGDAVNVASRLEKLTREQGCELVASARVVAAAGEQPAVRRLEEGPLVPLRGHEELVRIWTYGGAPLAAVAGA
jgi:adenylate cyclase